MKTFTGSAIECVRLRNADAKLHGLPAPGTLIGKGPSKIGNGPIDDNWWGWTRWRYEVNRENGFFVYSVDENYEVALTSLKAIELLGQAEVKACQLLIAKAVVIYSLEENNS